MIRYSALIRLSRNLFLSMVGVKCLSLREEMELGEPEGAGILYFVGAVHILGLEGCNNASSYHCSWNMLHVGLSCFLIFLLECCGSRFEGSTSMRFLNLCLNLLPSLACLLQACMNRALRREGVSAVSGSASVTAPERRPGSLGSATNSTSCKNLNV